MLPDWLTKIIVGVSLIQLGNVPGYVRRLGDLIGAGIIGGQPDRGFGVSLVVFYVTAGFLYGYLATRLYLQGALARAERGIEQEGLRGERVLQAQAGKVSQQVQEALQRPLEETPATEAVPPGEIDDHLRALADEYLNIRIGDWAARVQKKNELAAAMGAHVIKRGISRDRLAEQTNEGLLLALATAVHAQPEPADTDRQIKAAYHVNRLHVQYRFVLAFTRLLELGYVTSEQKAAIRRILDAYESRADASLRQAIAGLRRQLG